MDAVGGLLFETGEEESFILEELDVGSTDGQSAWKTGWVRLDLLCRLDVGNAVDDHLLKKQLGVFGLDGMREDATEKPLKISEM